MSSVRVLAANTLAGVVAVLLIFVLSILLFISTSVWCLLRPFIAVGLFVLRALSADRSIPARAEKTIKKLDEKFGMWG